MSEGRLALEAVTCLRGGRLLFRDLTLMLEAGQSALLRGPNGIGKSSLIRLAAGLLRPFAGQIARTGRVAVSDEALALDMDAPLLRALAFWARIDGGDAIVALEALGLAALADIPVRMLSTGQRKRAMLARVVASGAPIWLLDEPANGLDSAAQHLLGTCMAKHLAQGGLILAASHQPLPLAGAREIDLASFAPVTP